MDKLKVLVGLLYTQVMFCDEYGKLQFHRVMTDVNRPWLSIREVLRMVKQALCMDKPTGYNLLIQSVHIDIQYRKIDFTSLLETLREEMELYLSEGCEVFIETIKDYGEFVGEGSEEKVGDWEGCVWGSSLLESIDNNEEPEMIQMRWVQKEWVEPSTYSDYNDMPLRSFEPHGPFKVRIMSSGLLLEDRISGLFIDGGHLNLNKENDLRGSP